MGHKVYAAHDVIVKITSLDGSLFLFPSDCILRPVFAWRVSLRRGSLLCAAAVREMVRFVAPITFLPFCWTGVCANRVTRCAATCTTIRPMSGGITL